MRTMFAEGRCERVAAVTSVDVELVLVSLGAMLSPTTLTFSVLSLVLAKRPLRTGVWFYLGAFVVTIAIGILAAFVIGDVAAPSSNGERKTWVSVFDVVAAVVLLVYVARTWRVPIAEKTTKGMVEKMSSVASSPWIAVFAAGATLANPGGFIPLALKAISETGPTAAGYAVTWLLFTLVSLLPLGLAVILLIVSPARAETFLAKSRVWLEGHLRLIASIIILLLAISLLRNGIAGLTS
jgi:Sap-like sulfolipid-1-addressing protein